MTAKYTNTSFAVFPQNTPSFHSKAAAVICANAAPAIILSNNAKKSIKIYLAYNVGQNPRVPPPTTPLRTRH